MIPTLLQDQKNLFFTHFDFGEFQMRLKRTFQLFVIYESHYKYLGMCSSVLNSLY